MIDFQLTQADEKILGAAHEQAIIGRRYARYYDKHEDELEPAEFPEAKDLPNPITLAEEAVERQQRIEDSSFAGHAGSLLGRDCAASLQMGTRQHRAQDGRDARANREVEEPHDSDRDYRAGRRLRPGQHSHDGDVRSGDRRMDSQRREDFHLAGAVGRRGDGAVAIYRAGRNPRHDDLPGRKGHARIHRRTAAEEARHPLARHLQPVVRELPNPGVQPYQGRFQIDDVGVQRLAADGRRDGAGRRARRIGLHA